MARAAVLYIECGYGAGRRAVYRMRIWRNWQTRRFQVPVGDRAGSTPVIRTKIAVQGFSLHRYFFVIQLLIIFGKRHFYIAVVAVEFERFSSARSVIYVGIALFDCTFYCIINYTARKRA